MPKKVLMLLSNPFLPDPRVEKEAKALVGDGYNVAVLAWDRGGCRPSTETDGDVQIQRVRTRATNGIISYLVNYARYFYKSFLIGSKEAPDIIHANDFDTLLLGILISRLKGTKLVYDAHEHYAMMIKVDAGARAANMVDCLESRMVGTADLVIAANEHILEYLRPRLRGQAEVVMNCVDVIEKLPERPSPSDRLRIFYAGSLEPQRYIPELLDAVAMNDRTELRIAGRGRYEEAVKRMAQSCPRIEFLGLITPEEVLDRTSKSDVVFSMLDPRNENYRIATPIKVLEAMAMGVPLMVSKGTWSADIVERIGCGVALDWSPTAFDKAVALLLDPERRKAMGDKGRKAAESEFNWKMMEERLLSSYRRMSEE